MASYLFVCIDCLDRSRLVGVTAAPADFDHRCESCHAKESLRLQEEASRLKEERTALRATRKPKAKGKARVAVTR